MTPNRNLSRQEQKAATRESLKKAAIACFESQGFAQAKISDITRGAGVAQGTFYVHFASKEVLLDELLAEFNQGLVARLAPAWFHAADRPLPERIRGTAEIFLAYWEEHHAFVEIYAERAAAGLGVEALRDGINPEAAGLMTGKLAEFVGTRGLSAPAARLVVYGLLALWARVGLQALFREDVSHAEAVDTLASLTVGALSGVLPNGME